MQTSGKHTPSRESADPGAGATGFGDQPAMPAVSSGPNMPGLSVVVVLAMSEAVADCLRLFNE